MSNLVEEWERDPYETVFLVGAGVVENAWSPFIQAADDFAGKKIKISPVALCSYLVFQARLFWKDGTSEELKKEQLDRLNRFKDFICKSYRKAQEEKSIYLRDSKKYVQDLARGKSLIITTNWDMLLVDEFAKTGRFSVVSLHGNLDEPSGLYLPMETTLEPYWGGKDRHYQFLNYVHRLTVAAIEGAQRIVVLGHSLDFYDSEVSMLMTCARNDIGKPREFIVVDPETSPVERLEFLADTANVKHIRPI